MSADRDNTIGEPSPGPYYISTVPGMGYLRHNDGSISLMRPDPESPGDGYVIAIVNLTKRVKRGQGYRTYDPTQLGNLHLLSAAADMHQALLRAREFAVEVERYNDRTTDVHGGDAAEVLRWIDDVLAKAKGVGFKIESREEYEVRLRKEWARKKKD